MIKKLKPYKISKISNDILELIYSPEFIEKVNNFFVFKIFIILNLGASIGEYIAIRTGVLSAELIYIPILHFTLLIFPVFMHSNRPPYFIKIFNNKFMLKYKGLFLGSNESIIQKGSINFIEIKTYVIKGWHKSDINAVLKNKNSILLFRSLAEEDNQLAMLKEVMNHLNMITGLEIKYNI